MKKNVIFLGALLLSSAAYSQVGINNETPKATLDVSAKTPSTTAEGIIAPRLSGDDIKGKDGQYLADQKGAIVYATSAVGTPSVKTANITAEGYYYFDGAIWVKFGTGTASAGVEPWYNQADGTPATANTQNIYQTGKVAINTPTTNKQFEVKGDLKSTYTATGFYSSIDNNDTTTFGVPTNALVVADNADFASATRINALYANNNVGAALLSTDLGSGSSAQNLNTATSGVATSVITTAAGNRTTSLRLASGTGAEITDGFSTGTGYKSTLRVERANGINFNFLNSSGTTEGSYTFPRNNGSANQVLTTDGNSTLSTLSWKDVSSLVTVPTEPWYNVATNTEATANTQNIYQMGNVGIGTSTPTRPLEIVRQNSAAFNAGISLNEYNTGSGNTGAQISINNAKGTPLAPVSLSNGDTVGGFNFGYYAGGAFTAGNGSKIMSHYRGDGTNFRNDLSFFTTGATNTSSVKAYISPDGNFGIATINPSNKLHVSATADPARLEGLQSGAATDAIVTADATGVLRTVTAASLASSLEPWQVQGGTAKATTNAENIYQTGSVSIGSSAVIPTFTSNSITITPKLHVAGDVASTGSYYTTTGKYADYVFEDYYDGVSKIDETYKFKSLAETAAYIKANKHLPGVTSIKDILKTENGYNVNLSELSIQQLEKIEELYLHTIEQQQEISKQKTEINDLKSRMEKLEQLLLKKNNK